MSEKMVQWRPSGRATLLAVAAFGLLVIGGQRIYHQQQIDPSVREISTEHFVISYRGVSGKDARRVADALEASYARVLSSLGVKTHPVVTTYLHPTQAAFDEATGWHGAVGTSAGPRVIHLTWPRASRQAAVHEFAHTVQLTRLIEYGQRYGWTEAEFEERFANDYPRWLWEGVSTYLAGELNRPGVFWLMRSGHRPPLSSFVRSNNDIYSVGYTIPEYILHRWGPESLADLVGSFGDIQGTLGLSPEDFERGWHEFVDSHYWTL